VSQAGVPEILPAYVLDASALLAQLNGEPGFDVVEALISRSVISSVNWAEVLQKVIARGSREVRDVQEDLASLGLQVLPFTEEDAGPTARLWSTTRQAGLSLGDRACLSLAQKLGLSALTTDRGWTALNLEVEVRLIR
jgi:PIN domain nuclease of toxin-antitoxin system